MKPGKLWTPILKRSVLNTINYNSSKSAAKLRVGEDAADFLQDDKGMMTSVAMREGNDPILVHYAINNALNNIYANHGIPFAVSISLNLRKGEEEGILKQWIKNADNICREMSLRILGGHTSVSAENSSTVFSVTAFGKKREGIALQRYREKKNYNGYSIIMTKYAGLEGTTRLAEKYANDLCRRYTDGFLNNAVNYMDYSSVSKEADIIWDYIDNADIEDGVSVPIFHDISEGGILAALWELSELLSCGLEIDMQKISLKQLTIEICEFLDINPYMLRSCGSLLIATDRPDEIMQKLWENNIYAEDIGKITNKKDRILINQDEIRYIEPFRGDSMYLC